MSENPNIINGFIIAILATAFGWSLNQISHWYSGKKLDKRSMKVVQYYLLELYNIFIRTDINSYVNTVTKRISEVTGADFNTNGGIELIRNIFTDFAEGTILPHLLEELKILEPKYQSAIQDLASMDPLTAYYLAGKPSFLERFETAKSTMGDFISSYSPETGNTQEEATKFMIALKPDLLLEATTELENDIKKIAKKINILHYRSTLKVIDRIKKSPNTLASEALEKILANIKNK